MAHRNNPKADFSQCAPLIVLSKDLSEYVSRDQRHFLSDSQVETLLTIVSLGRVACLEIPHVWTLSQRSPTERANVPFGRVGSVCGVARRAEPYDSAASEFYAPFIALPLSTRSHFSVLIVDPGDQRAYHFDSHQGLHNEMVDSILTNNWRWMMPTAAGDEPTLAQLRARTTRLHCLQRQYNCGVAVVRTVRQLEIYMGERREDFAMASRRPALMRDVFDAAVADGESLDAYRNALAEMVEDFIALHVAVSELAVDPLNTTSPMRVLMPDGISPSAALGYTTKERVEANLLVSWLQARFVWFRVFSTLCTSNLVQTLDGGFPALLVNCNDDGSLVHGVTMLVPPVGRQTKWIAVGSIVPLSLTRRTLETRLSEIAGAAHVAQGELRYQPVSIGYEMDRMTPLVIGIAAAVDARLWNAGSNQRGWVAEHVGDIVATLVTKLEADGHNLRPAHQEQEKRLSAAIANPCYGLLARQVHEHVRRRLDDADKRALAGVGVHVGLSAAGRDPKAALHEALYRRCDELMLRLEQLSVPQLELCYNDASSVYNYVATTPVALELIQDVNEFILDPVAHEPMKMGIFEIVARLSHIVPILWLNASDPSAILCAIHAEQLPPLVMANRIPVVLPVYVFYANPVQEDIFMQDQANADNIRVDLPVYFGIEEPEVVPARLGPAQIFHGVWSLPMLLKKIVSGEVIPTSRPPSLSKEDGEFVLKMMGNCILWPDSKHVQQTGTLEFGAFVSSIVPHQALFHLQCYDGRFPWICLDPPCPSAAH